MVSRPTPQHHVRATSVHDIDGARSYILALDGHGSATVRIDADGMIQMLTRCGWAELGSTRVIDGGLDEYLARAAAMAFPVSGEIVIAWA